LSGVW